MTVDDVRKAVENVRYYAVERKDDEVAHSEEDDLYRSVLHSIADGTAEDPRALASEALKTEAIDFAHWCA